MAGDDVSAVTDLLSRTKVDAGTELSFADKGLKLDNEKDAGEIVEAIKKCSEMKALRLEGNTFGVDACKAISKALEGHPEFQKAYWRDMFTGRLKTEIPEALRYLGGGIMLANARLAEIDLSDNAFGPVGVEGIVELLKSPSCYTLKELRLNNNGLGIGGGKALSKALLDCYNASAKAGTPLALRVFVSGRNRLENDGAKALAEVFKSIKSLEEVSMPQNGIYFQGIGALAAAFSVNPNLRVINMNDNTFTEKGAQAMAKAIENLHNLEHINLGDCLLRTEGATLIAKSLERGHDKLQEVNLGFNEIKKAGGIAIAESVANKPNIKKLEIDGNQFGENGCEEISQILEGFGKSNIISSLDDDEGDDDDDDDDDDEDVDEEEEEEEEEQGEDESEEITARSFLESPSAKGLLALGNNRVNLLLEELGELTPDTAVGCMMKVSMFVTEENNPLKEAACQCTDAILSPMFKSAESNETVGIASNTILVHLGLIKSEDKKFKLPTSVLGPMIVLEHAIRQPYFPRPTKDILQVFLSRPNKLVDACGTAKHKFLQTLYQF